MVWGAEPRTGLNPSWTYRVVACGWRSMGSAIDRGGTGVGAHKLGAQDDKRQCRFADLQRIVMARSQGRGPIKIASAGTARLNPFRGAGQRAAAGMAAEEAAEL